MNKVWLCLFLGMICFGVGEYVSKLYANVPKFYFASIAVIAYAGGTIAWLGMMRANNNLALMSIIWVVSSGIMAVLLGVFVFKESLTVTQWIGAILAFVSAYLLVK